jgi:hypothetical protein
MGAIDCHVTASLLLHSFDERGLETESRVRQHRMHGLMSGAWKRSRVRQHRMHGLMSGAWKRSTVSGPQRLQRKCVDSAGPTATAPAPDSTPSARCRVCTNGLATNPRGV